PLLPTRLAFQNLFGMVSPASFATADTKPVGSGAYKFNSLQAGPKLVYDRFDGYWDKSVARAAHLELYGGITAQSLNDALRTGQLDGGITSFSVLADLKALEA